MNLNFGAVVVLFFAMVFAIPIAAIWFDYRQKMARIQAEARHRADAAVTAAIDALREEMHQLRDTTTKYDLSFDTALQRLERRVTALEQRGAVSQPEAAAQLSVQQ